MANVLVIGATSAVAQEIIQLLAHEENNRFYFLARNPSKLQALCETLPGKVLGSSSLDFVRHDDMQTAMQQALTTLSTIDLALLAHGDLGDQLLSEKDYQHAEKIFATNALSAIFPILQLANAMEKQGFGQITTIGSVAGERGRPRNYTYGAAKGAVGLYLQGVRSRLWSQGICVQYIKLGPVDTPMTVDHEKNFSFTSASRAAELIVKAIRCKKAEVYIPGFWRLVLLAVRYMPEFLFQKLKFLSGR
ncbi:MAG: SDR family NAD(P)-dependent oxidoreductase [Spirochaetota bacterium]